MSLDDEDLTPRELAARDRARDWAILEAEWRDREACESVEARETYWAGVWATMAGDWTTEQRWETDHG